MKEVASDNGNIRLEGDNPSYGLLKSQVDIEFTLINSGLGESVVPTIPQVHVR
jgi:hypothetical protein